MFTSMTRNPLLTAALLISFFGFSRDALGQG